MCRILNSVSNGSVLFLALLFLSACRSTKLTQEYQHETITADSVSHVSSSCSGTLIELLDTMSTTSNLTVTFVSVSEDMDTLGHILHRTNQTATVSRGSQTSTRSILVRCDSAIVTDSTTTVSHSSINTSMDLQQSVSSVMDTLRTAVLLVLLAVAVFFIGRYSKTILNWLIHI